MRPISRMRVAFLTPEYPTERAGGGLAAYVRRMAISLMEAGHEPEVFVFGQQASGVIVDKEIRVERTAPGGYLPSPLEAVITRVGLGAVAGNIRSAMGLAAAFGRRDAACPFNIVQSSDYSFPGLFVRPRAGRTDMVRCSWAADLYQRIDGVTGAGARVNSWLERRLISRADAVYAPSEFIAGHLRQRFGLDVAVLRPPALLETSTAPLPPAQLPPRYLVFAGRICRRKGTDTLAAALPLVWQEAPDLCMVWLGPESHAGTMHRYRSAWGDRQHQVTYLGVQPTAEVYAAVCGAEASVCPSIADNFPNAVIESLLLGVPVIGSRGASIDELVEDDASGILVPIEDPVELAAAMLRVWRRTTPWRPGEFQTPERVRALTPQRAVREFLELARQSHHLA